MRSRGVSEAIFKVFGELEDVTSECVRDCSCDTSGVDSGRSECWDIMDGQE